MTKARLRISNTFETQDILVGVVCDVLDDKRRRENTKPSRRLNKLSDSIATTANYENLPLFDIH